MALFDKLVLLRKLSAILCIALLLLLPVPAFAAAYSPAELEELRGVAEDILGETYTYITTVKWNAVVVEVEDDQFYDLTDFVQQSPVFSDFPIIVCAKSGEMTLGRDDDGWYLAVLNAIPTDGESIPDPPGTGDAPRIPAGTALLALGGALVLLPRAAHTRKRPERQINLRH